MMNEAVLHLKRQSVYGMTLLHTDRHERKRYSWNCKCRPI